MKTPRGCCLCAQAPLEIVGLDLEGPKAAKCWSRSWTTGVCYTDAYTLDGFDSDGLFPSVLGH
jgi:S-(hydroxymethyl)glutathione dehydrogenase / alcohol dehydrogenase